MASGPAEPVWWSTAVASSPQTTVLFPTISSGLETMSTPTSCRTCCDTVSSHVSYVSGFQEKLCTQARTEVSQIFAEPLCNNPTLRLHWAHEWLDRTLSYKTGEDTASVLCPTLLVWIYKLWMEQNVTFCSVFSLQHLFCYSENIPYGCTGNSINYVVCWYKILTVCTHMYHKHDRLL